MKKNPLFWWTGKDKGVGDTIARVIGPIGGDAFKAWRKSAGRPCKCSSRQEKLNQKYPYP